MDTLYEALVGSQGLPLTLSLTWTFDRAQDSFEEPAEGLWFRV
jgi:hypothetical protein